MILAHKLQRRTGITLPILRQRHHIRTRGNLPLPLPLLIQPHYPQLLNLPLPILLNHLMILSQSITTSGSLVRVALLRSQVVPRSPDAPAALEELRHGGLVGDGGVLVVEGAQAEELLEELPGADQIADADGDGGFADVPELVGGCHWGLEVVDPGFR